MANVRSQPAGAGTAELVQRAQAGDRSAFDLLYREFARTVHGIVLAACGHDSADDVTQDVFLHAYTRLGDLRDPAAFAGWLCAAARNSAVDRQRARRREPQATQLEERAGREPVPAEVFAARAGAARALGCIQRLPDAYRETLTLRLVEGLSGPEIAERTGLTHGSVRVNLVRGMAMLRPLLAEAGLP